MKGTRDLGLLYTNDEPKECILATLMQIGEEIQMTASLLPVFYFKLVEQLSLGEVRSKLVSHYEQLKQNT